VISHTGRKAGYCVARYDPGIDYRLVEGSGDPVCSRFLGASRKYAEPEREARSSGVGKYFLAYWVRVGSDTYVIIQAGKTVGERFGEVINVCTYIDPNDLLNPSSSSPSLTTPNLDSETSELLDEVRTLAHLVPRTAISFDSIMKLVRTVRAGRSIVSVKSREEPYLSYVKLLATIASVTNNLLLSNAEVSSEVQNKLSDLAIYTVSDRVPTEVHVGSDLTPVSMLLTELALIRGITLIERVANIPDERPSELYKLLLNEQARNIVLKHLSKPAPKIGLVQEKRAEFNVVRYVSGDETVGMCMRELRDNEAEFFNWVSELLQDLGYTKESEYCLSTYGRPKEIKLKVVFKGGLERLEGAELPTPTLLSGAGIYDVQISKDSTKYFIVYYNDIEKLKKLNECLEHALTGYEGAIRDVRGYAIVNYRGRSGLLKHGVSKGLALIIKDVGEGIYSVDKLEITDEFREGDIPCLRAIKAKGVWDLSSLASIVVEDGSDTSTREVLLIKPLPRGGEVLVRIFKRGEQSYQSDLEASPRGMS